MSTKEALVALVGSDWTCKVYFFDYSASTQKIQRYDYLQLYKLADRITDRFDDIICLEYHKANLSSLQITRAVFFHAFVVVGTSNGEYYSFEKNTKGIFIQRSQRKDDVAKYLVQVDANSPSGFIIQERIKANRKYKVTSQLNPEIAKKASGKAIIGWICSNMELYRPYNLQFDNCKYFSNRLLNMLTNSKFDIAKPKKVNKVLLELTLFEDPLITEEIDKNIRRGTFKHTKAFYKDKLLAKKNQFEMIINDPNLTDDCKIDDIRKVEKKVKKYIAVIEKTNDLIVHSLGYLSSKTLFLTNHITTWRCLLTEIAKWKDSNKLTSVSGSGFINLSLPGPSNIEPISVLYDDDDEVDEDDDDETSELSNITEID